MIEFFVETALELVVEGAVSATSEKKIPLFLRVLIGILLIGFYMGIVGLIVYIGIKNASLVIVGMGIALFILVVYLVGRKYREIRKLK